jgi:hypothetical protein
MTLDLIIIARAMYVYKIIVIKIMRPIDTVMSRKLKATVHIRIRFRNSYAIGGFLSCRHAHE